MTRQAASAAPDDEVCAERLLGRLLGGRGFVLAASGGLDSTALMLLVAAWTKRPPVLVVSIDHGLRPESAAEAVLAAANAERLGLPCRVMRLPPRDGRGNLQDWARRARYRFLAEAARQSGFATIVTAHHRGDQAETFLMRLARGSGVYGLSAMPEECDLAGLRLVRPLLGVSRADLARIVDASGLPVALDPGNADSRFDRVRIRKILPALSDAGLSAPRLARAATAMNRAAAALDHYADRLLRDGFRVDELGRAHGFAAAFADVPEEVGLRALALILRAVAGADYTPRLDGLIGLRSAILAAAANGPKLRRTLHGVVIEVRDGCCVAAREWGREGLSRLAAPPGSSLVWDGRFRVEVPALDGLEVAPLGASARRLRCAQGGRDAVRALPGLYVESRLLAVPAGVEAVDDGERLGRIKANCLVATRLTPRPPAPDVSDAR